MKNACRSCENGVRVIVHHGGKAITTRNTFASSLRVVSLVRLDAECLGEDEVDMLGNPDTHTFVIKCFFIERFQAVKGEIVL